MTHQAEIRASMLDMARRRRWCGACGLYIPYSDVSHTHHQDGGGRALIPCRAWELTAEESALDRQRNLQGGAPGINEPCGHERHL